MEIKYDDWFGFFVEEHEIESMEAYSKIYLENEDIVKREYYLDKELKKQEYFTTELEDRDTLIQKYNSSGIITHIGERAYIEQFIHEKLFIFDEAGQMVDIVNFVYDSERNLIVSSHTLDFEEEIPVWDDTRKYYVDENIRPGDDLFDCHFQESGELIPIMLDIEELDLGEHDGIWVYNNEEGILDLMKYFSMSRSLAEFYVSTEIFPWKIGS